MMTLLFKQRGRFKRVRSEDASLALGNVSSPIPHVSQTVRKTLKNVGKHNRSGGNVYKYVAGKW